MLGIRIQVVFSGILAIMMMAYVVSAEGNGVIEVSGSKIFTSKVELVSRSLNPDIDIFISE